MATVGVPALIYDLSMQLRMLGSVDLHHQGVATPVRGVRNIRLLAALAARVHQPVPPDVIAETIWPHGSPPSAAGAIQVAVSHARRLLAAPDAPAIVTEPGGYRLVATPEQLDLLAFDEHFGAARRAAREGRVAARARSLEEALRLWRGPAFGGVDDAGFVAAESRRLDERRLVAEEDLLAAMLQLGRCDEVLERVGASILAHPYRERFVGLEMLALYRSGRQSEALAAFERLRVRLRDEMGLRPGEEVRQLERLVLVQDPSLDAPVAATTDEGERDPPAVHVSITWPTDPLGMRPGGETSVPEPAACVDLVAALPGARAAAAGGGGVGIAVSSEVADLIAIAAPPGRILVDAAIAQTLRDVAVGGALADLGEHQLADLGVPHRLAEWCGSDGDGGPIRSCSVVPTRLGSDPTPFVGRQALRSAVGQRLGVDRLVCLVGPPGAGKTRLARRVAAERAWAFPGGAWFVELEALRGDDDIASAVAPALDVILRAGFDPVVEVGRRLAQQPALLVLDNAEQVAAATARFVEAIARLAPATTVLVTTRQRLGAAGEQVVPIGPLSDRADLDDACTILRARVQAAGGAPMQPDDETALVRRVDGLPLALELIAPQIAALGSDAVLDRLGDLLTGDALDVTFRTSESRLAAVDRTVLRRLSVFAGPFTVEAAERVVVDGADRGVELSEVARALSRLVDASLLVSTETGGRVRHRMLAVVRALAAQRLDQSGEAAPTRDRHAKWASRAAWEHAGALVGRQTERARIELDLMLPDVRAALDHLDRGDDRDRHLFMVAGLWFYWYFSGRLREGRSVTLAAVRHPGGRPEHRALGLAAAANLAWWQCDYRDARRCLEAARSVSEVPADVGFFDIVDGSLAWIEGDLERAARHLDEALGRARRTAGFELPMAAAMRGNISWWQGDHQGAADLYREGRDASIARKNVYTEVLCGRHEGLQLGLLGRFDEARALTRDAHARCRRLGDALGIGQALVYAGLIELRADAGERAAVLLSEGVRAAVQPGDVFCLAVAAPAVAHVFVGFGEHGAAARWLGWRAGILSRAGLTASVSDREMLGELEREIAERLGPDADRHERACGRGLSLDELAALTPVGDR